MTKIDIFSGFLGAGKTTLIKKLIEEAYKDEKIVLIENEFGEIGIDGGFLSDVGIQVNEMNSGCICCSLVGDFSAALQKVIEEYAPDRILIEPSGVGKLSDVIKAVKNVDTHGAELNSFTTVVDAKKCKMHMKNFGEFFNDQVEYAGCIVLSHTGDISEQKIFESVELLREHNASATIVTTPWNALVGDQLIEAMECRSTLADELKSLENQAHEHHHDDNECCHHEHHHDDNECCHHEHHHDDDECCHHEHHHDDDEHCHREHHHNYDENGICSCGHHHHADDVFTSYGTETVKKFDPEKLRTVLAEFVDREKFGMVLRAKGIVEAVDGRWIHFDYVPGEPDIRYGGAGIIGRLCVIGSNLNKEAISTELGVNFD